MQPDIVCPACGATHAVVSLRAVHLEGTSSVETFSTHSGVGITLAGAFLPVTGTTSTLQVRTTSLVAETTPVPAARSTAGPIAVALFGLVVFMLTWPLAALLLAEKANDGGSVAVHAGVYLAVFGLPVLGAFAVAAARARGNRRIAQGEPIALTIFGNSWYCGRCGGCFVTQTPRAEVLPAGQLMAPRHYRLRLWRVAGFI